jgi:cytochrome c553
MKLCNKKKNQLQNTVFLIPFYNFACLVINFIKKSFMVRFSLFTISAMLILSFFACKGDGSKEPPFTVNNAANGKELYNMCIACHAQDGAGIATLNTPAIVHQEKWYMKRQIMNFRDGIRGSHPDDIHGSQMAAITKSLSDKDIDDLVDFIKTLEPKIVTATVEGDIKLGVSLYKDICAACHGPKALGIEALHSPKLAGTNDWYLKRQMEYYRDGIRGADPRDTLGMQMVPMVKQLKDEESINHVIAYIQHLYEADAQE